MARKVFQDFAHVLCQRFIEVPSSVDLVNLFILDSGRLEFDVLAGRARFNDYPLDPFPYVDNARVWLEGRLISDGIPKAELTGATLKIAFRTTVDRGRPPFPSARFNLSCIGFVSSQDRSYEASIDAEKSWGILPLSKRVINTTPAS